MAANTFFMAKARLRFISPVSIVLSPVQFR
jgi:hypothetical protein